MERKEVKIPVTNFIYPYDFEGTIEDVSEMIRSIPQRLVESYPLNKDFKVAHRFEIEHYMASDYGIDDYTAYKVNVVRWENDKELNTRLKEEFNKKAFEEESRKKKLKNTEANERKLYEKLKRKYGK